MRAGNSKWATPSVQTDEETSPASSIHQLLVGPDPSRSWQISLLIAVVAECQPHSSASCRLSHLPTQRNDSHRCRDMASTQLSLLGQMPLELHAALVERLSAQADQGEAYILTELVYHRSEHC